MSGNGVIDLVVALAGAPLVFLIVTVVWVIRGRP
jgi:hypothetical protein